MRHIDEVVRLLEKQRRLAEKESLEEILLRNPINLERITEFQIMHTTIMRERRDVDWRIKEQLEKIAKEVTPEKEQEKN